jgi:hypothetical protein
MCKHMRHLAAALLLLISSIIGANVLTSSPANAQTVVVSGFNVVGTTPVPQFRRGPHPNPTHDLAIRRT